VILGSRFFYQSPKASILKESEPAAGVNCRMEPAEEANIYPRKSFCIPFGGMIWLLCEAESYMKEGKAMYKKTIMIASIWFFVGILILVPAAIAQTTDNLFDIYGNLGNSATILSTDTPVEIFKASDNFATVQVIDEPFGLYENWSSPNIRSDRWLVKTDRAHEARREVVMKWPYLGMPNLCLPEAEARGDHLLMRFRLEGQPTSPPSFVAASQTFRVSNPLEIKKIEVKFLIKDYDVIGCAADATNQWQKTRIRPAAISLSKFNDDTAAGLQDFTGTHFVRVMANREAFSTDPEGMLTVQAFLFRCTDAVCSNASSAVFNLDMGKVMVGKPFSLRISWDEPNHRFLVGYNTNPDVILEYDPELNHEPPHAPFADFHTQLVNATCGEGTTVTDAEIKVREVRTNVSAVIP